MLTRFAAQRLSLIGSACLGLTAGCADLEPPQPFELPFAAVVGTTPFSCDGELVVGTSGVAVRPIDLRLYIHDVAVIADGERIPVTLEDSAFQGQGIVLLDFEDDTGSCATGSPETNTIVRGTLPAGTVPDKVTFRLGVPGALNHLDAATGPAPLNVPGMWWSWTGGYKYMRADVASPEHPAFYFHLGATSCSGDPSAGFSCAFDNVAEVTLDGTSVVLDLAALYAGVDVSAPLAEGDFVPGCMAFSGDPDCPAMFAPFGLAFEGGAIEAASSIFRGEP